MKHLVLILALLFGTNLAGAAEIRFDTNWQEQRFSLFSKNRYSFGGNRLGVRSDGSVSMAYIRLGEPYWPAKQAAWSWSVSEGVPATDLTKKGGDDRNLSVYAVFLPESKADQLKDAGIRTLLGEDSARVLVYVWGGEHSRGDMLASPYLGERGRTIVLRPSSTGAFAENVNLASDYERAFGPVSGVLVGLAVSADSDDTDTSIRANIEGLQVN